MKQEVSAKYKVKISIHAEGCQAVSLNNLKNNIKTLILL